MEIKCSVINRHFFHSYKLIKTTQGIFTQYSKLSQAQVKMPTVFPTNYFKVKYCSSSCRALKRIKIGYNHNEMSKSLYFYYVFTCEFRNVWLTSVGVMKLSIVCPHDLIANITCSGTLATRTWPWDKTSIIT